MPTSESTHEAPAASATKLTEAEKRQHLHEVMAAFDTAMLVTASDEGSFRARPLSLAREHDQERLYFSTAIDSGKVAELARDARVVVCMQDKRRFVSVSGTARVERDRALIDRLWSEAWRIWFPKGKDDPSLCILVVEPEAAEYWDISGATGLRYVFASAKAYLTGTRPAEDDDRQNAKVSF